MKVTLSKLMRLNRLVGKYLIVRMPEPKAQDAGLKIDANWFKTVSCIAPDHNSLEMGYVEEVFSRFLRQLS